jgi:hypothetical protein
MNIKGFWNFYGVYIGVILAAATLVAELVGRDVIIQNYLIFTAIAVAVLLLPFIVLGIANSKGAFAKWLRLVAFSLFQVRAFAGVGFIILLLFSMLFLFNLLFRGSYQGEQIFLNVFLLNLLFVFFLSLVLSGRFEIKQPSALLIKNTGHQEIYLFQDGVIRHIPDPPTLSLLGYSPNDIVEVNDAEFEAYQKRPVIQSVINARFVTTEEKDIVWIIFRDTKKRIPDLATLNFLQSLHKRDIDVVSADTLNTWKETDPLVSILSMRYSLPLYNSGSTTDQGIDYIERSDSQANEHEGTESIKTKFQQQQVIFQDADFSDWTPYEGGIVSQSKDIAPRTGVYVLKKSGPEVDPSGGWKKIEKNIDLGFIFSGWIYRPDKQDAAGKGDRLAVENSTYQAYGFAVDHNSNTAWIERRDGKGKQGQPIGSKIPFTPISLVDQWYRFEFTAELGGKFSLQIYDQSGKLLVNVPTVSDDKYSSFDRVGVHGGFPYYVDNLKIQAL